MLEEKQPTNTAHRIMILLMDEILHQLIWSISHSLQGFMHPQVVVWDFFHQEYVYVQYEKKHLFSNWFILPQQRVLLAVSRNSGPRMVGLQGRPMEDEAKGSCGTIHHSKYMNFSDLFFLSSKNHHGWNIQRDKTYYIYIYVDVLTLSDWVSNMLFCHVFLKTSPGRFQGKENTIFVFQASFVQHKTAPTHGER